MKQILSEEFRRMKKIAGLITENEINEAVNPLKDLITLLTQVKKIADENISKADNFDLEDFSQVIESYIDSLEEIGEFETYPEELDEDKNLNEWALDMNAARTHITPENVESHGTYDPDTNTIEIEGGSDQMYEFFSDVYIAHEGEPENWWQNEKVIGPLRYRYEQAIEKAAKQKYGPDVTVEYY